MKISINSRLYIYDYEVVEKFVRSSGPGGQNVNKSSTAVHLSFNINENDSLPSYVRKSLLEMGGKRVNSEGVIVIKAMRYKSLDKNRNDALARLKKIISAAEKKPKERKTTSPSKTSKEKRLKDKKIKGELKRLRQKTHQEDN